MVPRPDVPMPLGEHLDELRRRLLWPLVAWAAVFIIAFAFQDQLKRLFVWPLQRAIAIAGPEVAARAGILVPPEDPHRLLKTFSLGESMGVAVSLAMWAAFAVVIPLLAWQLYAFAAVGLTARERRLAFILVPLAIILFYAGGIFGYFFGMPYIYAWFIDWTAQDPVASFDLRLQAYWHDFLLYTLVFGVLFDIPWAMLVLARLGFVGAAGFARWRKPAFMLATIVAALIGPGDPFIMLVLMIPTYGLYEIGILVTRLFGQREVRDA
ncbi:MAG: twin-arginine translocase subunit TatC [Planctomycetota bacterium]|nr:twin-arginine translocase subunit TatC [Planctomycetota bacterium]MCX8040146.1 twin-arginine translocase subunit TatC [Planctomycetota bacterium]MDW8373396.1 twin-arginine translocase subunit TatC [Planctomycetota bacterium]